jgi:Lon protease-like protein
MSAFLPLFPLRLVVYPGEELNLHIFEPRYKELINECEERGITFGIPAFMEEKVQPVGTEIQLLSIDKRYPNGEMDIRTKGVGLFKIKEFYLKVEDREYTAAEIERLTFDLEGDFLKNEQILLHMGELYSILQIKKKLPEHTSQFSTYEIAHLVGFSLEQEYEFLTLPEEQSRQDYMLKHLERLLPMAREMEELRKKVQMNGHFQNVLPPELGKG